MQRRTPADEVDPEKAVVDTIPQYPLVARLFQVNILKKRLEEQEEAYHECYIHVREKLIGMLSICLPKLFQALSDCSHACFDGYRSLEALTQS